ncbi:hypothetical protein B484DRAFT_200870 [Ochromonadaceae sp. CCMP2298]|nr:hypothetical protein B484DRAFT_200870 [Ochromonadaceae sp. CCMP2298]
MPLCPVLVAVVRVAGALRHHELPPLQDGRDAAGAESPQRGVALLLEQLRFQQSHTRQTLHPWAPRCAAQSGSLFYHVHHAISGRGRGGALQGRAAQRGCPQTDAIEETAATATALFCSRVEWVI